MKRRGFTLVELSIVILSILALWALPKYENMEREAKAAACKANLGAVRSAIAISYARTRHLPVNQNGNLANYKSDGNYDNSTALFEVIPVNPYCKGVQQYFSSVADVSSYNPCEGNKKMGVLVVKTDSNDVLLKSAKVKPCYVDCSNLPPGEDPNNW